MLMLPREVVPYSVPEVGREMISHRLHRSQQEGRRKQIVKTPQETHFHEHKNKTDQDVEVLNLRQRFYTVESDPHSRFSRGVDIGGGGPNLVATSARA